jgi:anaerobic selenocysteine-containing dehydrogenase
VEIADARWGETTLNENASKKDAGEQQNVVGLGFCGPSAGSNTSVAEAKDGKLIRLRPLHFDWKYERESLNPWRMEVRGKVLEPPMKSLIPPYSQGYKKRVYSSNRVLYPLKRVDWDPNGERNPQNRGVSKYRRISWEEALDIVESEIRRIHATHGPFAILPQWGGHGETKVVHNPHGYPNALLGLMGGYTFEVRNPDSWEGWHWGAMHVWGNPPVGQPTSSNCMLDSQRNREMLLYWGCETETTPWGVDGQMATRLCYFFAELGIDSVFICPDLNYGAAVHADKWIPIRPGTDAALQLAIAYVWITEGTFDRPYVDTHSYGYEKFEEYVLGKEDGVPKTPAWASDKTAIPEWTIKALARQWAKKATSITHGNGGPGIRSPYSTENGRLEVLLLAMQTLGGPGRHYVKMIEWWQFCRQNPMPNGTIYPTVGAAMATMPKVRRFNMSRDDALGDDDQRPEPPEPPEKKTGGSGTTTALLEKIAESSGPSGNPDEGAQMLFPPLPKHIIPKDLVHDALNNPSVTWHGTGSIGQPIEDQFVKYTFPAEGGSKIHMIWTDSPCYTTCWNDSNSYHKGVRSPEIEFVLAQHPWLENDCYFADLILPVSTKFEEEDIDNDNHNGQFFMVNYQRQTIEPLGESLSDFEVVGEVAKRFGLYEQFANGRTVDEMIEDGFNASGMGEFVTYEEWKEKGYAVVPTDPDWDQAPPGMRGFHDDPAKHRLLTPSGKIEFFSQNLAKFFPDDEERPPVPHWIEKGVSHDERVSSERARKYPLLMLSNHPHWRMHANADDITWTREVPTCKVKAWDGYLYEPLWMHPSDAAARGIEDGDILKIHNERGVVLGGAYVSERVMPGAVSMDHGARYDPIVPGWFDRGGAVNTLTPHNTTSKNATGMVCSSFLVEVEKVTEATMEAWKDAYPEAFSRPYDPAQGVCLAGWLEGEM